MALLSNVHDALPQIYLITDGSVDDEHNICQTMKTEITNRGSKSPRISTFGLGNILEHFQSKLCSCSTLNSTQAVLDLTRLLPVFL
jgi:hypothetical protein